jgi:hypothetical protein
MIRERLGIESYPMLILFKNGTIVNQCAVREAYKIVDWVKEKLIPLSFELNCS